MGKCSLSDVTAGTVERGLFEQLYLDGRALIKSWVMRGLEEDSAFPGFIYLWLAVNGWGACVADSDRDADWVNAVAADDELGHRFAEATSGDGELSERAGAFASLWPVFESRELRRLGVWLGPSVDRASRITAYREAGASRCEPACWEQHVGLVPVDWWHTLKTLYRVRNNLFHGEKAMYLANDREIVEAAYGLLAAACTELELIV